MKEKMFKIKNVNAKHHIILNEVEVAILLTNIRLVKNKDGKLEYTIEENEATKELGVLTRNQNEVEVLE